MKTCEVFIILAIEFRGITLSSVSLNEQLAKLRLTRLLLLGRKLFLLTPLNGIISYLPDILKKRGEVTIKNFGTCLSRISLESCGESLEINFICDFPLD